jgi:hypothetical protein
MPLVGFEPTTSVYKLAKVHALDRTATVISIVDQYECKMNILVVKLGL